MESYTILAGTANPRLAAAVARELGVALGACTVNRFPDGEVSVHLDQSVRGREVYIVQPTSPPVNDHLVELLAFADACRRAAAARVTAVVPYFGYARADKRQSRREPITASTVADVMQSAGIDHVVTIDVHTPQIEGFFRIPVDDLTAVPTLCAALHHRISGETVLVSPDLGGIRRATEYSHRLGVPVVVCYKRRTSGAEVEIAQLIGDVRDRSCLIVDDMISTGATIVESIKALLQAGAHPEFRVAATHGVFVDGARDRLAEAGVREVFVTDTLAMPETEWPELRVVSVAPLIAAALRRLSADESLSDLF